ncbi:flagellar basal body-associated FliL family protein [Methylophaga sp. OBS4]|uniref:flagellar basal body-associated FliL family protein n=1 Tax=Methylophaga sp. OBS4 TaxID=2991935 RepID=UPI00225C1B60|nr:flagellar basal body-associated FliL family protein [Methylophaga sp. OBS4]MCX4188643.1 flagellar basal body-associated FliL family protein [Methylophaga sp. OBS4]
MHKMLTSLLLGLSLIWTLPAMSAADTSSAANRAVYYQIEEPFTINFLNQSQQKARYLQIKVALMSHQANIIDNAKLNLPMIQDALRTLFTAQSYDNVSSVAGRTQLQQEAEHLVSSLLQEETGQKGLDKVYFTSFILQ